MHRIALELSQKSTEGIVAGPAGRICCGGRIFCVGKVFRGM